MPRDANIDERPVLTSSGRAWIQARYDRARERIARIDEDLALDRSEDLLHERWQLENDAEALARILNDAVNPAEVRDDPSIVEIGDEVEIELPDGTRDVFLIVHPLEAGMDDVRTSCEAPLARAVLGQRLGDACEVRTPAGSYTCTIVRRERLD